MEPAKLAKVIIEEYKLPLSVEEFLRLEKEIHINELKKVQLMPGVRKLVTHLHRHQVPMAIATGSGVDSWAIKTKKFGDFFQQGKYFR